MSPLYYPSGLKKFLEQELRQKCDAVFGEEVGEQVEIVRVGGERVVGEAGFDGDVCEELVDARAELVWPRGLGFRRSVRRQIHGSCGALQG